MTKVRFKNWRTYETTDPQRKKRKKERKKEEKKKKKKRRRKKQSAYSCFVAERRIHKMLTNPFRIQKFVYFGMIIADK